MKGFSAENIAQLIYNISTKGGAEARAAIAGVNAEVERGNKATLTQEQMYGRILGAQRNYLRVQGELSSATEKLTQGEFRRSQAMSQILTAGDKIRTYTGNAIDLEDKHSKAIQNTARSGFMKANALDMLVGRFVLYTQAVMYGTMIIQAYDKEHKKMIDAAVKGEEKLEEKHRTLTRALEGEKKAAEELNLVRGEMLSESATREADAQATASLLTADAMERQRDAMQDMLSKKQEWGEFWYQLTQAPNANMKLTGQEKVQWQGLADQAIADIQGQFSQRPSPEDARGAVNRYFQQRPELKWLWDNYGDYVGHEVQQQWHGRPTPLGDTYKGDDYRTQGPRMPGFIEDAAMGGVPSISMADVLMKNDSSDLTPSRALQEPATNEVAGIVGKLGLLKSSLQAGTYAWTQAVESGTAGVFSAITDGYETYGPGFRQNLVDAGLGYWGMLYDRQEAKAKKPKEWQPSDINIAGILQGGGGTAARAGLGGHILDAVRAFGNRQMVMRPGVGTEPPGYPGGYYEPVQIYDEYVMDGRPSMPEHSEVARGRARRQRHRAQGYAMAGGLARGGLEGALMTGAAFLPGNWGGLAAAGIPILGDMLGGLFGGGGGKHKDLGLKSNPVWMMSEQLESLQRDLLNILTPLIAAQSAQRISSLFTQAGAQGGGVVTRTASGVRVR